MTARNPDVIEPDANEYDADALVTRLKRNALVSMIGVATLVAAVWREPMAVVGALLGGVLVLLNFILLEGVASRVLKTASRPPNPLQLVFLALRFVLMGLILYGIFALPGVRPIPVALGLSIVVLAIVIESFSQVFSSVSSRP
ncbi:MAG: ATP synthase subunit I [Acidobacteria bacterium]|nr:ATP synthase subunit I [Acidobacteriota bacterium]